VFWVAVIGRVREIDEMRTNDRPTFREPGPPTMVSQYRPGALPPAQRAPATFYQAPYRRRDFFQETATHPDYRGAGVPRYGADYGGAAVGQRPYVTKYTVPPRY